MIHASFSFLSFFQDFERSSFPTTLRCAVYRWLSDPEMQKFRFRKIHPRRSSCCQPQSPARTTATRAAVLRAGPACRRTLVFVIVSKGVESKFERDWRGLAGDRRSSARPLALWAAETKPALASSCPPRRPALLDAPDAPPPLPLSLGPYSFLEGSAPAPAASRVVLVPGPRRPLLPCASAPTCHDPAALVRRRQPGQPGKKPPSRARLPKPPPARARALRAPPAPGHLLTGLPAPPHLPSPPLPPAFWHS